MPKSDSALDPVLVKVKSIRKLEQKEDVYCLSALKNGNMIANGIVVKNCDALRYACYTHKPVTYKKPPEMEQPFQNYNRFDPWKK